MTNFDDFISSLTDDQKAKFMEALSNNNQKITKPTTPKNNENQSQQKSVTVGNDFKVHKTENTTNSRRREPVKARKNEWIDEGEGRDIETNYGERTPRTRKPQKKVEVDCSVCGRSFKTDPRYVYGEYHRCSRCVGK